MNRLIICGSIRPEGKSALVADALARRMHELWPDDEINVFSLADDIDVDPCLACDYCELGEGCIIEDEMQGLYALIDEAESIVVVSPIYFAGPPAQFKAVLDRFQVYFWTDLRTKTKRSAELFAIGDGGDPHGFDPLAGIVRSALAVAGLRLDAVHDCVAKTPDELLEITAAWEPVQPGADSVRNGGAATRADVLSDPRR